MFDDNHEPLDLHFLLMRSARIAAALWTFRGHGKDLWA